MSFIPSLSNSRSFLLRFAEIERAGHDIPPLVGAEPELIYSIGLVAAASVEHSMFGL